jgi:hypothetical protein
MSTCFSWLIEHLFIVSSSQNHHESQQMRCTFALLICTQKLQLGLRGSSGDQGVNCIEHIKDAHNAHNIINSQGRLQSPPTFPNRRPTIGPHIADPTQTCSHVDL